MKNQKIETVHFPEFKQNFWKSIGPSLVTLGLGIGSGEFILWPYMTSRFGFGIMWGALLGITLQLIIISEIGRYTVVKGESIVHGFARLNKYIPLWLIGSTLVGFGWPGFAATAAALLSYLLGVPAEYSKFVAIGVLIFCGMILLGKNVYSKIEALQKVVVPVSFVILLVLFFSYLSPDRLTEAFLGILGFGDGYFGFPKGLDFAVFLGAFAYAGSGGNFLLGQSFYVIEKEYGNANRAEKLNMSEKVAEKEVELFGEFAISEDEKSLKNFKALRRFQIFEGVFVFWLLGFSTIFILSYLSRTILYDVPGLPKDFSFLTIEASFISQKMGNFWGVLFVLIGAFALISVQLGALDIMGRFTALAARISGMFKGLSLSKFYSRAVLLQMTFGIGIFLLGFTEPVFLIVVGAVINAFSMAVLTILVLLVNRRFLPKAYRPSLFIQGVLLFAAIIYLGLFMVNLVNVLLK